MHRVRPRPAREARPGRRSRPPDRQRPAPPGRPRLAQRRHQAPAVRRPLRDPLRHSRRPPRPRPRQRAAAGRSPAGGPYRDAFLAEVKAAKPTFYNLVVAQAFSIDASASGVTFAFQPNQKVPKAQCEDNRAWVQGIIEKVIGREAAGAHRLHRRQRPASPSPPPAAAGSRARARQRRAEGRGPRARDRAAPARNVPGREDHGSGRVGIRDQGSGTRWHHGSSGNDEAGAGGAAAAAAADERVAHRRPPPAAGW